MKGVLSIVDHMKSKWEEEMLWIQKGIHQQDGYLNDHFQTLLNRSSR